MEFFLPFLLYTSLLLGDHIGDPANEAWFGGRQALRQSECERLSHAEAYDRFPGRLPPPSARAQVLFQIDALSCERLLLPAGLRAPRDEAILRSLRDEVEPLVGLAAATGNDDTRWLVDAHYPDLVTGAKIATAARTAMAARGLATSNVGPLLPGGDVEVLRTMPLRDALPLACRRMEEGFVLDDPRAADDDERNVAWMTVALLHPHETQLHAGTCHRGVFRWLR